MYPLRPSKKAFTVIVTLGFLGSILLSAWKGNIETAHAYFPQQEVFTHPLQKVNTGVLSDVINAAPKKGYVFDGRVSAGSDDAEERVGDGLIFTNSVDLELIYDPGVAQGNQTVGMRFSNVAIPNGAIITQAYIEFQVDEATSEATSVVFYGQSSADALTFTPSAHNISNRAKTVTSVNWSNIDAWNTVGAQVQSPDLSGIVQEIVNQDGWAAGNSLAILVEGSGRRVASSYEAGSATAPLLHVAYTSSSSTSTATPLSPATATATPTLNVFVKPTSTPTPLSTAIVPTATELSTLIAPTATQLANTVTPTPTSQPSGEMAIDLRVTARENDAEERTSDGRVSLTSNDLELIYDPGIAKDNQIVGMRFSGVAIPKGSTILGAYIEFEVDQVTSETTSLVLSGQAADDASAFTKANGDISNRPQTSASVSWNNVPAWNNVGDRVQSPDLAGIVQEVIDRDRWSTGNSLAILVEGTGRRVAAAYESGAVHAALLHVVYLPAVPTSTPTPPEPPPPSDTPTPTSMTTPTDSPTPPTSTSTSTSTSTPTTTSTPPPGNPTPVGQTGNWNMVFNDEFNGNSLDTSKWRTCFWWADTTCTIESNHEMELYNPEDVSVGNGQLHLRAQKRDMVAWNGTTYHYTSGMVMTGGRSGQMPPSFTFVYGYIEALVKVPAGQGLWPALWTLSADYQWPPEIDVMEILGHEPTAYHMNYHYAGGKAGSTWNGPDFSAGWHVIGLEWTADAITWFVDGIERWRFTDSSKITSDPSYLLLNLAVGGDWPGAPDGTTPFPSFFDIEYIRVWQK